MKKSIYKNYDELPLFLNAKTLAEVLGIAPSSAYEHRLARVETITPDKNKRKQGGKRRLAKP